MKSAIEVIANVQSVRGACHLDLLRMVVSHYFLSERKKGATQCGCPHLCRDAAPTPAIPSLQASSSRVDQGSGSSTRPIDIRIVISIPLAKKPADDLGRLARGLLGEVDEVPPGRPADAGARRGRRTTRSSASASAGRGRVAIPMYASPIACSASWPVLPFAASANAAYSLVDAALRSRRGRAPSSSRRGGRGTAARCRPPGDVLGRCAVVALDGELVRRRVEHGVAAAPRPSAWSWTGCSSVVSIHSPAVACQAKAASASATRSRSRSVSRVWNGSASARSKARSAPGKRALVGVGGEPVQRVRADLRLDPLRAQRRRAPRRGGRAGRRTPASRAGRPVGGRRGLDDARRAAPRSRPRPARARRAAPRAARAAGSRARRARPGCR